MGRPASQSSGHLHPCPSLRPNPRKRSRHGRVRRPPQTDAPRSGETRRRRSSPRCSRRRTPQENVVVACVVCVPRNPGSPLRIGRDGWSPVVRIAGRDPHRLAIQATGEDVKSLLPSALPRNIAIAGNHIDITPWIGSDPPLGTEFPVVRRIAAGKDVPVPVPLLGPQDRRAAVRKSHHHGAPNVTAARCRIDRIAPARIASAYQGDPVSVALELDRIEVSRQSRSLVDGSARRVLHVCAKN